jgi:hypothetical protein
MRGAGVRAATATLELRENSPASFVLAAGPQQGGGLAPCGVSGGAWPAEMWAEPVGRGLGWAEHSTGLEEDADRAGPVEELEGALGGGASGRVGRDLAQGLGLGGAWWGGACVEPGGYSIGGGGGGCCGWV